MLGNTGHRIAEDAVAASDTVRGQATYVVGAGPIPNGSRAGECADRVFVGTEAPGLRRSGYRLGRLSAVRTLVSRGCALLRAIATSIAAARRNHRGGHQLGQYKSAPWIVPHLICVPVQENLTEPALVRTSMSLWSMIQGRGVFREKN